MDSAIEGLVLENLRSCDLQPMGSSARLDIVRPVNVVFHGFGKQFGYEYYGVHQGTEDRLTFLGPETRKIHAYFIDCRYDSPTFKQKFEHLFSPMADRVLVIPPGVAHTFDGLEDVVTINSFRNFLPDPDKWISGEIEWNIAADTINLPRNIDSHDIEPIRYNSLEASDHFYDLTSQNISRQQTDAIKQYPLTKPFTFANGETKILKFTKNTHKLSSISEVECVDGFDNVFWYRRSVVTGSDDQDAGYTTLSGPNKLIIMYSSDRTVVTRESFYLHDSCRVIFLGPPDTKTEVLLKDHRSFVRLLVSSSAFRELALPQSVEFTFITQKQVVLILKRS